ncbi:MAG: hypothetical protein CM15mP49_30700 [Actinomycetota bacterium]|nr:MAG: hypothetical protein CM15mP49_30700 [Actinomycetota bacterium]
MSELSLTYRLPANPPINSLENGSRLSLTAKKVICAMIALGAGHMMMLVTFATFLEDEHNVSTSGLGFVAVIIGLAELVGSGGVALIGDKIGKVVVVKYALMLSLPLSIILPLGSSSLGGFTSYLTLVHLYRIGNRIYAFNLH